MYYCYKQDWKQHEQWKQQKYNFVFEQYLDQILLYQLNIFNWKPIWFLLTTSFNKPKIFLVFKLGCLFFLKIWKGSLSLSPFGFWSNNWCNQKDN